MQFGNISTLCTFSPLQHSCMLLHWTPQSVGFANSHIGLSKFNDLDLTKFQAQDFDVIQDWRRTTLMKHHHTPARLSSPTINTGASSWKY